MPPFFSNLFFIPVSEKTRKQLDPYRGFRHVVRNAYTYHAVSFNNRYRRVMDNYFRVATSRFYARRISTSRNLSAILSAANEQLERHYQLRARGVTFEMRVENVAQWLNVEPQEVLRAGKQPLRAKARDILCYFANRELGMSTVELARILNIGQSAISRSIQRGEKITDTENLAYRFKECIKRCPPSHPSYRSKLLTFLDNDSPLC